MEAFGLELVVSTRSTTTHRAPGLGPRRDQFFLLEPIKRRVDGARGHVAFKPVLNFFQNRPTVALPPDFCMRMEERQQHGLFEGA